MKCDVLRPGWIQGCCTLPKWWWCEDPMKIKTEILREAFDAADAELPPAGTVPVPKSIEEARAMLGVANFYLQQHIAGDPSKGVTLPSPFRVEEPKA